MTEKPAEGAKSLVTWIGNRGILAIIAGIIILFFFGPNIPSSGVVTFETDVIQLNGFLLAFVAIAFSGMVAEVRSRTDLGIDQRKKLSKEIRVASFYSFLYLMFALVGAIGVLEVAISEPNGALGSYFAELFPLSFTIFGMGLLLFALYVYSRMD